MSTLIALFVGIGCKRKGLFGLLGLDLAVAFHSWGCEGMEMDEE
jgi:hypothetical protein